jgi:hypothetical protein
MENIRTSKAKYAIGKIYLDIAMPCDLNCHYMSIGMKAHLMGLIRQGHSHAQVMVHHKAYVREKALNNEYVTLNPSNKWKHLCAPI